MIPGNLATYAFLIVSAFSGNDSRPKETAQPETETMIFTAEVLFTSASINADSSHLVLLRSSEIFSVSSVYGLYPIRTVFYYLFISVTIILLRVISIQS